MDLQSVLVRSYEQRNDPKPHVVYLIQVHTSTRDWTIRQRYSAFEDLVGALAHETGEPPPGALPPKRTWMHPFGSASDSQSLDERRGGLERWLRGVVGAKDPRWRESRAFREFLAVPASRRAGCGGGPGADGRGPEGASFTLRSWLVEHDALRSLAQDIRARFAKRDALASDPTQAHATSVAAKKLLAALVARLSALAKGLKDLSMGPGPGAGEPALSEGEMRRRGDMVSALQDECEALGRLSVAARAGPSALRSAPGSAQTQASPLARRELLGGGGGPHKPTSRVLGVQPPPAETPETRPLDNVGLLQLQQEAIDAQDDRIVGLAAILRRQRDIGMAINQELMQQNELLDDLSGQIDRTGTKLGDAKQRMRKLDGGK